MNTEKVNTTYGLDKIHISAYTFIALVIGVGGYFTKTQSEMINHNTKEIHELRRAQFQDRLELYRQINGVHTQQEVCTEVQKQVLRTLDELKRDTRNLRGLK